MPDEVERQDWYVMQELIEYRNAKAAIDAMNDGEAGAKRLADHPQLAQAITAMMAAQQETLD